MSCEYENGSGCDRILVQPWYAWLICSRCSSRDICSRSLSSPCRESAATRTCIQPRTASGRRRACSNVSFSFVVRRSSPSAERFCARRTSCIISAKKTRPYRPSSFTSASSSPSPGRSRPVKSSRRMNERVALHSVPTQPRASQKREYAVFDLNTRRSERQLPITAQ